MEGGQGAERRRWARFGILSCASLVCAAAGGGGVAVSRCVLAAARGVVGECWRRRRGCRCGAGEGGLERGWARGRVGLGGLFYCASLVCAAAGGGGRRLVLCNVGEEGEERLSSADGGMWGIKGNAGYVARLGSARHGCNTDSANWGVRGQLWWGQGGGRTANTCS